MSSAAVAPDSLLESIAALIPADHREEYYRTMAALRHISPNDEILLVVKAMGLLSLIVQGVPDQIRDVLQAGGLDRGELVSGTREVSEACTEFVASLKKGAGEITPALAMMQAELANAGAHTRAVSDALRQEWQRATLLLMGLASAVGAMAGYLACGVMK